MRPCTLHVGTTPEDSGRDRNTQTTKEGERTSEGEAESVAKWTAGTGDAQGTQAECQIELVQSRGIITNEFKTEASAGEDREVSNKEEGVDLLQGTKHWTGGRGGRRESRGSQHWGRQERVGE